MNAEQVVKETVASVLGIHEREVKLDQRLGEDLGADSLDKVDLLMDLESRFEIEVSEAEGEKVHTVRELVEVVRSKGFA